MGRYNDKGIKVGAELEESFRLEQSLLTVETEFKESWS